MFERDRLSLFQRNAIDRTNTMNLKEQDKRYDHQSGDLWME